jgi:hypothetical protein
MNEIRTNHKASSEIEPCKVENSTFMKFQELDSKVFEIFNRLKGDSIPINGPIIKSIEIKIASQLGRSNFIA